jgi:hypothetical protein
MFLDDRNAEMSDTFNERVNAELKAAAQKAGLIDHDWLKFVDVTKITRQDDGSVKGAADLVAALKEAKPFLFPKKMARDMSETERAEAWAAIKRGPKPEPMDLSKTKTAKEMTPTARDAFLKEVARRFG